MAKLWYTTELSLLAAMDFYANSIVLICDHFLIPSQFTMYIAFISLTCFYLLICDFLIKGNREFESLYWNFFNLMAALTLTSGDRKDWDFSRGLYSVLIGCTILALYTLYTWIIPPSQGQDQQNQNPGYVVPLPAEISFLFMANGIALMARFCFFHTNQLMLVGAAFMFLASAVFFTYFYHRYSSVKPASLPGTVDLHQD
ncbi:hypothetical protein LWI28_020456 [Acer negundo]|uniref:Uncharacterized protein n=1 Tax=Acer negundo TaxID=4023 RepID=A0AAD5JM01_ACENE|nr:hypothetical protein LWI28_020456 [Acer negundo]KAK4857389.1 hypothetical protein QYF36_027476 [Acer negundo]